MTSACGPSSSHRNTGTPSRRNTERAFGTVEDTRVGGLRRRYFCPAHRLPAIVCSRFRPVRGSALKFMRLSGNDRAARRTRDAQNYSCNHSLISA